MIHSLAYRIGGMGLGFVASGVLIRALGAERYGAWATLTSLLAWIQLSDFGVGYALKNRIAGAAKPGEILKLVCGVFQFYGLIAVAVVAVFLLLGRFLNIVRQYEVETYILYIGTAIFFPLTIGSAILQGLRKNSISTLMSFLQSICWMICVLLLAWVGTSLALLCLLNISLVLLTGLGQCALGIKALVSDIQESATEFFNFRNMRLAFPLCAIGIRFISLQLSGVILFSLGTYLTYSNLSSAEAAKYDILFKIFQIPLTFFNVVVSVYWVEIARSIALNDRKALKRKFMQLHQMASLVVLLMLVFSVAVASKFISVYSGGKIEISISDALSFWVMIVVQIFAYAGAVFLNAAEKLNGQIIFALIASTFLVPLVLLAYANGMGFSTVPLVTGVLIFPSLVYCNFSAYYHVIKKAD